MNNINFENNTVISKGVTYHINTEQIGYERLIKFIEWMPVVALGKSHLELMAFIAGIFQAMTSGGDDFKKTYFDVSMKLLNYTKSFESANSEDFLKKNLDTILMFCALFCNTAEEDISVFNEAAIKRKVESFKSDCNIWDFFFLAKKLVPLYSEKLSALIPQKK